MACASESSSKVEKESMSDHLNCAICLERYKRPRALACLHTFCEGCVHSFIMKEAEKGAGITSITCPLCRTETSPPNPDNPPSEWTKDLPQNYAIVPILESLESKEQHLVACEGCSYESQSAPEAKSFCIDCQHNLCADCILMHKKLKILSAHKIVTLEEASKSRHNTFDLGKLEYCSVHPDKSIEFYCEDHNALCCSTCAIVKHRQCKTVLEVKELGQRLKSDGKVEQLQTKMSSLHNKLGEVRKTLETSTKSIETQADDIVQKMVDMRNQIVKTVDSLVARVTDNCNQVKKQHAVELHDQIFSTESLLAAIASSCSLLESVMKNVTETQLFIVLHKLEEQVKGYEKMTKEACSNVPEYDLHLDLLNRLGEFVRSLQSLANVAVRKEAKRKFFDVAECTIEQLPPINVTKHPDHQQPGYRGVVYLPDGRLIATDCNNSLCCLLDDNYNVKAYVKLPGEPGNLAVVGSSEVVVCICSTDQLQHVIVGTTLTLSETIPCNGRKPRCVSRVSDTEVAVGWSKGLGVITLDGKEKMYIDKDSSGREIMFSIDCRFIVNVQKSCIIQSCKNTNTVYCFNFSGNVVFRYKGDLSQPRGLVLDRDDNIYVCDWHDSKTTIHQITPQGRLIRIVDAGLTPYTVCLNPAGEQLLAMDYSYTNKAVKFRFVPPV